MRLQNFLTYIVDETLAGRGEKLLGKTIAADVYNRLPSQDGDPSNLVRVDARRLRQALSSYYKSVGVDDPIWIHVDPGQYAVRFEVRPERADPGGAAIKSRYGARIAISLVALAVAGGLALLVIDQRPWTESDLDLSPPSRSGEAEREALMLKSPAALQASNLAEQARDLIFPAIDPIRLRATRDMFEHAVRLDPLQFRAHAGLAQVIGLQAFRFPPGEEKAALLELGMEHANQALQLNPSAAWTQSALAWMAFARGDVDEARSYSARALAIAPEDLSVVDFDSLIAFFGGDFERVISVANPANYSVNSPGRHVFRISYATAKFHLGDFQGCISELKRAAAAGSPVGPISHAYLIAAHQRAGQSADARRLLEEFEKSWPDSRFHLALKLLFVDDNDLEALLSALREAGWKAPEN
ncbi:hypothetical protein [Roseibium sp.]|uniref:tetratricopeptide repeat protein n=1 Tax=Roseibium sp. TaxID=1936156 RepID=UPI003A97B558